MKNKLLLLYLLSSIIFINNKLNAQHFSSTLDNSDNELIVKIKAVGGDITTGFSGIEFFLRAPTSSPSFSFGTIQPNLTDFPDIADLQYSGENQQGNETGYNNHWFSWNLGAANATTKTYSSGVEYEVFRVPVLGNGNVDFQIVGNDWYSPTYVALNAPDGTDWTDLTDLFYGSNLGNNPGDNGGTTFWKQVDNVSLPINIISLNVTKYNSTSSYLFWTSENEVDFDRFEIQRSIDGRNWVYAGTVKSYSLFRSSDYSFIDRDVYDGVGNQTFYYRLKLIDIDGGYRFSKIRDVTFEAKDAVVNLEIYPNPSSEKVFFTLSGIDSDSDVNIDILDINGKIAYRKNMENLSKSNLLLDNTIIRLQSGMYNVIISDKKGHRVYKKLILAR